MNRDSKQPFLHRISYITLVWAIVFSDLSSFHPADNVLLVVKVYKYPRKILPAFQYFEYFNFLQSLAQSMVCVFMTAVMERWMVMWMMAYEDYPNAGALINGSLSKHT